ncbi:mucin-2-like [Scylla paramamosain]|uniref:mucin-2-like n=1 Tax=Scylla paramamosain TaxID=85552 RepID=UPI0030832E96
MEVEDDAPATTTTTTTRRRLPARQAKTTSLLDEYRAEESCSSPARISSALKRKADIKVENLYLQDNYKEPLPTPLETIFESPQPSRSQRGDCPEVSPLMARRKLKRLCVFGSHYQPSRTKLRHRRDRAHRMKQLRGVRVPLGKAFSEDDVQTALSCLVEEETTTTTTEEQVPSLPHSPTESVMERVTQGMSVLQMDCESSFASPGLAQQGPAASQPTKEQRRKRRSGLVVSPAGPIDASPGDHPARPPSAREKKLRRQSGLVFIDTTDTALGSQDAPGDCPPQPGPSKATGSRRKRQKTTSEAEQGNRPARVPRVRSGNKRTPDTSPASVKKKQRIPQSSLETPTAPSQRGKTRGKSRGTRRVSGVQRPLYSTTALSADSPNQSLTTNTPSPAIIPTSTTSPAIIPTSTTSPAIIPTSTTSPAIIPTSTPSPAIIPTSTTSPAIIPTSTPSPAITPNTPSPAIIPTSTPSPAITPNTPSPAIIPTSTPSPAIIPTNTPSPAITLTSSTSQATPTTSADPPASVTTKRDLTLITASPKTDNKEVPPAAPGASPTSPSTRMAALSLQCTPSPTTKPRKARRRSARLSLGMDASEELRKVADNSLLGTFWLATSPKERVAGAVQSDAGGGVGGDGDAPQPSPPSQSSVKRKKQARGRRRSNQFLPLPDIMETELTTTTTTTTITITTTNTSPAKPTPPENVPSPQSPITPAHPSLPKTPTTRLTPNGIVEEGRDAETKGMGKMGSSTSPHISEGSSPSLSPSSSKSDIQNIAILEDFSDLTTPSPASLISKTPASSTSSVRTSANPAAIVPSLYLTQCEEPPTPPTPSADHFLLPILTPNVGKQEVLPLSPSAGDRTAPDLTICCKSQPVPSFTPKKHLTVSPHIPSRHPKISSLTPSEHSKASFTPSGHSKTSPFTPKEHPITTVTPSTECVPSLTPNGDIPAPSFTPSTSQDTTTPGSITPAAHRDQHMCPEEEWDSPIVSGILTNETLIRMGRVYYGSQLTPSPRPSVM